MSDTVEYAVMKRCYGVDTIDGATVTTDVALARRDRELRQEIADYNASRGFRPQVQYVLAMRTCTPWCEVNEPKEIGEGNGQ